MTNNKQNTTKSGVIHLGLSDHSLILYDLSQIQWEDVALHDDPNTCYRVWRSYFLGVLVRHAPLKRIRILESSLPWITANIKELMQTREFHKKKAVKYNSRMYWAKYKEARNKVDSLMYKPKENFYCEKIKDCTLAKDHKKSWGWINELLGKNSKANNVSQLNIDENIISENIKI